MSGTPTQGPGARTVPFRTLYDEKRRRPSRSRRDRAALLAPCFDPDAWRVVPRSSRAAPRRISRSARAGALLRPLCPLQRPAAALTYARAAKRCPARPRRAEPMDVGGRSGPRSRARRNFVAVVWRAAYAAGALDVPGPDARRCSMLMNALPRTPEVSTCGFQPALPSLAWRGDYRASSRTPCVTASPERGHSSSCVPAAVVSHGVGTAKALRVVTGTASQVLASAGTGIVRHSSVRPHIALWGDCTGTFGLSSHHTAARTGPWG